MILYPYAKFHQVLTSSFRWNPFSPFLRNYYIIKNSLHLTAEVKNAIASGVSVRASPSRSRLDLGVPPEGGRFMTMSRIPNSILFMNFFELIFWFFLNDFFRTIKHWKEFFRCCINAWALTHLIQNWLLLVQTNLRNSFIFLKIVCNSLL